MTIAPKNWGEFQHYKKRSPPWIKLHHKILDNYDFHRLPVASRALAPMLWLLASEFSEGKITSSIEEIAFRFRMPIGDLKEAIKPLVDGGFFVYASAPLASRKRNNLPETEGETEIPEHEGDSTRKVVVRETGATP